MNKKITRSVLAALIIAGSTFLTVFAAMPSGTVLIGNKAFELDYANEEANLNEIIDQIVAGGAVYVKNFSGEWIDNVTGKTVTKSLIPAAVYKNAYEQINFDAADEDHVQAQKTSFSLGETAIINDSYYGKYELTVYKVEVVSERNQYEDTNPAEVYKVTYRYKLLAKGPEAYGLGIYEFDSAFDDSGKSGQYYPDTQLHYPSELKIVGTYCTAETFIAVTNPTDKLILTKDVNTGDNLDFVTFNVPTKNNNIIDPPVGASTNIVLPSVTYGLGKTAIINDSLYGKYELTINKVEVTSERNEFQDANPAEVYKVTYTYKLLAVGSDIDGLGVYGFESSIDNNGESGQDYQNTQIQFPEELKIVGTYCTAETFIAVTNPTDKLILTKDVYIDENSDFVTFVIPTK